MVHWPGLLPNQTEGFVEGIADVLDAGLAVAGGVSNFKASRVESAVKALGERGHCLASNQIQYSLLYRTVSSLRERSLKDREKRERERERERERRRRVSVSFSSLERRHPRENPKKKPKKTPKKLFQLQPETNDVIAACQANGVSVVAYTPLAQGLLTGKYHPEGKDERGSSLPGGPRAATITPARIAEVAPLVSLMRIVGKIHADGKDGAPKSPAQVALNWCLSKNAIPIAGVKSAKQASSAAGSMGWRLSGGELEELDAVSSKITPGLGFPTENW